MGFPTLKKLTQVFSDNAQVVFLAVQTVFEGFSFNTQEKLRENQLKYSLDIPMAHAAGNPETDRIPGIMRNYRTGGTPWKVIIGPDGKVAYNDYHIELDQAVAIIKGLIANQK